MNAGGIDGTPSFTGIASGVATVGTTEVQLPATPPGVITLRAAGANSGTITIGVTGLSSLGGLTLSAGQMVTLYLNNLNIVYAIASGSGQKLEYLAQS